MSKPRLRDKPPRVMFDLLPPEGRLARWFRETILKRPRHWEKVMIPDGDQCHIVTRGMPVRLQAHVLEICRRAVAKHPRCRYTFTFVHDGASRNAPCWCGSGKKSKECNTHNGMRGEGIVR